jgi:cytochrome c biogenesis protein
VPLTNGDDKLTVELTGLRVINVENFGAELGSGTDVRAVDLRQAIESRLGAANKTATEKQLRNIGPSFSYKLRDAAGQATEFNNYMLPVDVDGVRMFLLGMRESTATPFRYLRIPADEQGEIQGWMRLRAALKDADLRDKAVRAYASRSVDTERPELVMALTGSAARALSLFAGVDPSLKDLGGGAPLGGLEAVSAFMEANVPATEREKAGEVLVRILNGVLFELHQAARQKDGLKPLPEDETTRTFMTQSVLSLSDSFFYAAPFTLMMEDFNQVQASVFQVSRAPGKLVVYLGCVFLIVGIFAMLYVRERRLWVWLAPTAGHGSQATMALSTNRKTLEADTEFDTLKSRLLQLSPVKAS